MVRCGPGLDLNGCEMKNRLIVLPGRIEAKRPADLADANKPWGNANSLKAINRTKDREKLRKSTNFLIISFLIYFRFSINFSLSYFPLILVGSTREDIPPPSPFVSPCASVPPDAPCERSIRYTCIVVFALLLFCFDFTRGGARDIAQPLRRLSTICFAASVVRGRSFVIPASTRCQISTDCMEAYAWHSTVLHD